MANSTCRKTSSIPEADYEVMPIRVTHLNVYPANPTHDRSPFDKMLPAEAGANALVLISRDPEIAEYEVEILTCWALVQRL